MPIVIYSLFIILERVSCFSSVCVILMYGYFRFAYSAFIKQYMPQESDRVTVWVNLTHAVYIN